jgi:hypothetical protein
MRVSDEAIEALLRGDLLNFEEWEQAADWSLRDLRDSRAALRLAVEAMDCTLNVVSGIGKSGGWPSYDEYMGALDSLKAALAACRKVVGE